MLVGFHADGNQQLVVEPQVHRTAKSDVLILSCVDTNPNTVYYSTLQCLPVLLAMPLTSELNHQTVLQLTLELTPTTNC